MNWKKTPPAAPLGKKINGKKYLFGGAYTKKADAVREAKKTRSKPKVLSVRIVQGKSLSGKTIYMIYLHKAQYNQ